MAAVPALMRQDLTISNFTAGELSPRMKGRGDFEKYYNGCQAVQNMVVMPQGGVTRRPGTMMVALAQSQSLKSRLVNFVFSTVQAYIIEFGNTVARFYMNDGMIESGGVPVTIATPYGTADLDAIEYTQSDDTLFLCNPAYPVQLLTRASHTSWAINAAVFRDGPYLNVNATTTTLTFSATSGSITVTASSIVGINATPSNTGQGFLATDVGRLIRARPNGIWFWLRITAVTDTTHVTATVQVAVANGAYGPMDGATWPPSTDVPAGWYCANGGNYYKCTTAGTTAGSGGPTGTNTTTPVTDGTASWLFQNTSPAASTADWTLGKWSATTPAQPGVPSYPYWPMFWQNRLVFGGTNNQPNALEASVTGDFSNYAPTQADGTVTDINALSWVISDDQVNAVRWLSPAGSAQAMQLGIGTSGGENVMQAASTAAALTPANVQAYRETSLGSAPNVRPQRIGKSVLFANRPGRKLHEWTFQWTVNGYLGPDLTVLAEHITGGGNGGGIRQMAYQQSPHSVLWAFRADGLLIGLTYLREQDVVAWHQHPLGGQYYGGPPIVESIATIPSPDGSYDELWLVVLRTVAGTPTRTVEVMTRYFDLMNTEQGFFVDCGLSTALTYPSGTVIVQGFANSAPNSKPPAFTGAGTLSISGGTFAGGIANSIVRMNGGVLLVTQWLDATHVMVQTIASLTNLAPASAGTWSLNAPNASCSGLDHLNGETASVLADGQVIAPQTVAGGAVQVVPDATFITAGLPYVSALVTMPYAAARAAVNIQGRTKRVHKLYLRFHQTIGGLFGLRVTDEYTGTEADNVEAIMSRSAAAPMSQALALFSGIKRVAPTGSADREGVIMALQTDPLPLTVLSIGADADVEEVALS